MQGIEVRYAIVTINKKKASRLAAGC